MDMPSFDNLISAPALPIPQMLTAPTIAVPTTDTAASAPVAGAPPAKKARKPADPNKPKAPRKRKEPPAGDGTTAAQPPKKIRKKKEPELGPDGQPLPAPAGGDKPKKPRKKKPSEGGDGIKKEGKSSASKGGDEDDISNVGDEELIAASTVKRAKRGEDDEEEDDEENEKEGDEDEEGASADETELQLGEQIDTNPAELDLFGDQYLVTTQEENDKFEQERAKIKDLIDDFTPEQMERYEAYRRSRLPAASVRKVMNSTLGFSVAPDCGIVMAGASKLFVGELIETARIVQEQWSKANNISPPYGPLTPDCVREAYRRLKQQGKVPYITKGRLFKR